MRHEVTRPFPKCVVGGVRGPPSVAVATWRAGLIDSDGAVFPCTVTFGRIPGGNAAGVGVETAWRALHNHACVACYSPCMVEQNFLHSLEPGVLAHFARRYLWRFA